MPAPDARTRNKISLNPSRVLSNSIPSRLLPKIFLSNVLFVLAIQASKEWLLDFDVGVFWVVMRVLACGGLGVLVWEGMTGQVAKRKSFEWSVLGTASLLLFVQQACLFTALYRLSSTRVILFCHFSTLWIGSVLSMGSTRKIMAVATAFLISILSDTQLSASSFWRYFPGYGALVAHALSSTALEHTYGVLTPALGSTFTIAASTLGASIFALPFYIFRTLLGFPSTPVLPLISLAAIPVVSYSVLFLTPITAHSLSQASYTKQHFGMSYPILGALSAIFGSLAFSQLPGWTDLLVAGLLYVGMYPENIDTLTAPSRTPASRLMRSYLKTILSNPESRKIFYFLMLNLCYMLVQMLYGVWTNSLGLISDAIHMAFDCMAIGVGLFASVMATWEPNERFTYGYGRIETLSGFANGIFLILISIFIVFEAIQRILEPPEMNTNQLLLVSSLGLAVNLFGMFAMGGHHHHGGHSHSHGHSHSSGNGHAAHAGHSIALAPAHSHSHNEEHSHSHAPAPAPNRSHSHASSPISTHAHSHSHSPLASHSHSHSEPEPHSPQPHSPEHCDDHNHSHSHVESHSHSHEESHSHSPTKSHSHSHSHSEHSSSPEDHHSLASPSLTRPNIHSRSGSLTLGHKRPPSIHIHEAHDEHHNHQHSPSSPDIHKLDIMTPLTPSYSFVHDDHLENHHDHPIHTPSAHEGHSHNMRGVFLHVMADTLGSVGVIISTLLIQFYGWTGFDPIASLFIAILIAASVVPLVVDTGKVLCLDVAEKDADIRRALDELQSIQGLASFSSPRFWPKDSSSVIGSIHIQLAPSDSSHDPTGPHTNQRTTYTRLDRVVERVDSLLRTKIPGLEELTIQVEGQRHSL
ncbi:cation efflux family-domain-containing protein [Crucibulum laeve]|uniref:Cation efflux family-domain-containing protein n=1 Tax=Crucibulum laeve TaxID=68775 RepID=A0A5C3M2B0_9AGAR|nr:cation efflux family-domain-containing protein [Crucibulum laeve]